MRPTTLGIEPTKSATPVAIALRGIIANSASAGSCTRITPPDSFILRTPTAPSDAGAREHHGEAVAARAGDGFEELVDRRALASRLVKRPGLDRIALDHELAVGRDDVDAVGVKLGCPPPGGLHLGGAAEISTEWLG